MLIAAPVGAHTLKDTSAVNQGFSDLAVPHPPSSGPHFDWKHFLF
jgi:hypothetical protein